MCYTRKMSGSVQGSEAKRKKKKCLKNDGRRHALAIMKSRMPSDIKQLIKALMTFDARLLSHDKLETLKSGEITAAEIEECRKVDGPTLQAYFLHIFDDRILDLFLRKVLRWVVISF